jgi:hypothetical protein
MFFYSESNPNQEPTSNGIILHEVLPPDPELRRRDNFAKSIEKNCAEICLFGSFCHLCDFKSTSKHYLKLHMKNIHSKQGKPY